MKRSGLGKGLGMGYKNLVPMDRHIHSLSAKGVKTYSEKNPYLINVMYKDGTMETGRWSSKNKMFKLKKGKQNV